MSSSASHRLGLVPCPLCKNVPRYRQGCKACKGAGKMPVDEAIAIGMSLTDTEREMTAVREMVRETDPEKKDGE